MLIGLTGRKRSGKSTAARYLVESYGFTELVLANELKSMAYDVNPVVGYDEISGGVVPVYLAEVVDAYGWEAVKDLYPEARRFLERLGTEGVRNHLGEDAWVDRVEPQIEDIRSDDVHHRNGELTPIVVSDVRFENEAEMVVRNGGVIVEINRIPAPPPPSDPHPSEQGVAWDYQIDNVTGKPEVLAIELDRLVRWLSR